MKFIRFLKHFFDFKKFIKIIFSNYFSLFVISFIFKLIDILFFKKKNEILFYGYKGRYAGNSASLFKYCQSNKVKFNPIWLLDIRDAEYFKDEKSFYFLPTKNSSVYEHIRLLFKIASANVLVVSSVGDLRVYSSLLYSKKRLEILLPHGITLKTGGIMSKHLNNKQKKIWEKNAKRFDIVSVSSKMEQYRVSSSLNINPEKVKILGVQRGEHNLNKLNDDKNKLFQQIYNKLDKEINYENFLNSTKLLYAPTHRDHISLEYKNTLLEKIDGFNLEELNIFLKKENIILFLREHAESKLKSPNGNLNLKSNIINFSIEDFPDLEKYLNFIDVIITDYSGIFVEHLLTKKSLVFALFDLDEYESTRGLILPKNVLFPGYIFKSQDKLISYLKNREIIDKSYIDQRKYLYSLFFEKSSEGACKRTMEEIYKLT